MKPFISLSTNRQLLRNSKERKCHIDMKQFYIADSFTIIVLFNILLFRIVVQSRANVFANLETMQFLQPKKIRQSGYLPFGLSGLLLDCPCLKNSLYFTLLAYIYANIK